MSLLKRIHSRATAKQLPPLEEIERFGADGEDVIFRILREEFDSVIRGIVVPHGNKYLEKDFLVITRGAPIVIEVKNWKGVVGCDDGGEHFFQEKPNGTKKHLKSPVGTTRQFLRCMKEFYGIKREIGGVTVFADPDCRLQLPPEIDGIRLVRGPELVSCIRRMATELSREKEDIHPERLLRCVRTHSQDSEFCKGVLANESLRFYTEKGGEVRLDPTYLRYIRIEPQPLLLRDKLYVVYSNGAADVFYNRNEVLSLFCLDGACRQIAVNRLRHIFF